MTRREWIGSMVELYGIAVQLFLGFMIVLFFLFSKTAKAGLVMAGGLVAFACAAIGGVRLCLPLYFLTLVGTEIRLPGVPISLNRAAAGILVLAAVMDFWRHRLRLTVTAALVMMVVFHLYYLPAAFILKPPLAEYPIQSVFYILPMAVVVLLFWRRDWLNIFFRLVVVFALITGFLPGLLELLLGVNLTPSGLGRSMHGRINGLAMDSILFAYVNAWAIPLAIHQFIESRTSVVRAFFLFATVALAGICILTLNRQTPIILGGMIGAMILLVRYEKRTMILVSFILGSCLLLPFIIAKLLTRFTTATNILLDYSLMYRHDKIVIAREMWRDHFWFGIGHNHFKDLWYQYIPPGEIVWLHGNWLPIYVDSGYIQIFTDYGFIGACLFVLLMLACAFLFLRLYMESLTLRDRWYTNALAAVAAQFVQFMLANVISDAFVRPQTLITFSLLFALATAVKLEREWQYQQDASLPRLPEQEAAA